MLDDATSVTEEGGNPHPHEGVRLEPDLVLPVQLLGVPAAALQPEKRLMLAVLEDAVATLLAGGRVASRGGHQTRDEVERWFASADDDSPFTFVRICDALGLDAEYLRRGLGRVREPSKKPFSPLRRLAGARHAIGGS